MPIIKEPDRKLKQEEIDDFCNALGRIDKEKPCKEDVAKVEKMLTGNPRIWEGGFGLLGTTLHLYIKRLEESESQRLITEVEGRYIKEQLGYSASNQIERLIIDQILLCWVGVTHIERRLLVLMTQGHTAEEGEYLQNTLTRYQNRYLRAIETLARVRKLNKGIALQVNIATNGGQQVNVNEIKKR